MDIVELGVSKSIPSDRGVCLPLLGGKALSLHDLLRNGLPVPRAFCVTTAAFDAATADIKDQFLSIVRSVELSIPDQNKRLVSLRRRMESIDLAPQLLSALHSAWNTLRGSVSVRSSGISEDGTAASFAGQFETYLYVSSLEDVVRSVKMCWASSLSDRVIAYRRRAHAQLTWEPVAVVIQTMVFPVCAGVAFGMDPLAGNRDVVVIEAGLGVGEGVVQGSVTTDSFVVNKKTLQIASKTIREKKEKMVEDTARGVGATKAKVAASHQNRPALQDSAVESLAKLVLRVEETHGGAPQDIEWCYLPDPKVASDFWLLQSRPITAKPAAPCSADAAPQKHPGFYEFDSLDIPELLMPKLDVRNKCLFTRMDIGESFSGLKTPLSLSFADYFTRVFTPTSMKPLGLPNASGCDNLLRSFCGHLFINVSWLTSSGSQSLPLKDPSIFLEKYGTSMGIDLASYQNPFPAVPTLKALPSTLYWFLNMMKESILGSSRVEDAAKITRAELERFVRLDLPLMSRVEIGYEFQRAIDLYHLACEYYFPCWVNTMVAFDMLTMNARQLVGRENEYKVTQLVKLKIVETRTVELTEALSRIASAAKQSPDLAHLIVSTPAERVRSELLKTEDGRSFWDKHVFPFLLDHGIRGHQEMELTLPRWIDEPVFVFKMVQKYISEGFRFDEWKAARLRESAERERGHETFDQVFGHLPLLQRMKLKQLANQYVVSGEQRETVRPSWVLATWFLHKITKELGRRLCEVEGILQSADDVAFLTIHELLEYSKGSNPAKCYFSADRLERNRRLHEYHRLLPEPPNSFLGRYDPQRPLAVAADSTLLKGVAASGGKVTARARVIVDLDAQADEFLPGEVLVCKVTDPAWTPLFLTAAAVVADQGGILSHTSIVAREFGIPAVVGCNVATEAIRTGDTVVVDGTSGTVSIVRES